MSRKWLTDKELEEIWNQSSDSETEDHVEIEDDFSSDSDDSVADPDFAPNLNDIEEAFEKNLINMWSEPHTTRISEKQKRSELSQAGLSAPSTSVKFFMKFLIYFLSN